jgi:hypothetical protein
MPLNEELSAVDEGRKCRRGRRGVQLAPRSWPVVLWMPGLDGQGLGPNGFGKLVARFGTTAIFWSFHHT